MVDTPQVPTRFQGQVDSPTAYSMPKPGRAHLPPSGVPWGRQTEAPWRHLPEPRQAQPDHLKSRGPSYWSVPDRPKGSGTAARISPHPTPKVYGLTTRAVPAGLAGLVQEGTRLRPPASSPQGLPSTNAARAAETWGCPLKKKGQRVQGGRAGGARGHSGARPAAGKAGRQAASPGPGAPPHWRQQTLRPLDTSPTPVAARRTSLGPSRPPEWPPTPHPTTPSPAYHSSPQSCGRARSVPGSMPGVGGEGWGWADRLWQKMDMGARDAGPVEIPAGEEGAPSRREGHGSKSRLRGRGLAAEIGER